jgi:hypothetical protein
MTSRDHIAGRVFGLVAVVALGALALLYMADVGGDVMLAVIAALTPSAAP